MHGKLFASIGNGNVENDIGKVDELAKIVYHFTPYDGTFAQSIAGLHLRRYSNTNSEWIKSFYLPSVLIVVQGEKAVRLGKETFYIEKSHMFLVPIALPVALKTIQANSKEPFLGIGLTLDLEKIAEFIPKVYPNGIPLLSTHNIGYIAETEDGIIQAMTRLLECLHDSGDTELLAPIIKDEIMMRLLRSPIGIHIAELSFADSSVRQLSMAIEWLQNNFSQTMKVADLAKLAHMSVSVFHKRFKEVTSMSPLQYQKALRLQEARHLMLSKNMDALTACHLVGYASASQFNRDYNSYYGNPPRRDIERLHRQYEKFKKNL